jgi:hypothetical protein
MHEVRFHGRGGQGAVTSAEVLALAAITQGKSAQAFPSFGPERRGAPVIMQSIWRRGRNFAACGHTLTARTLMCRTCESEVWHVSNSPAGSQAVGA